MLSDDYNDGWERGFKVALGIVEQFLKIEGERVDRDRAAGTFPPGSYMDGKLHGERQALLKARILTAGEAETRT